LVLGAQMIGKNVGNFTTHMELSAWRSSLTFNLK
jgi:hypothetical protein